MTTAADKHLDIIWGARAIGEIVGLDSRQANYLLEKGYLPGRKIGERWISTRGELVRCVLGEAA